MVEWIIKGFWSAYGICSVCLGYFNAAGADSDGEIGEGHSSETHVISLILKIALGFNEYVKIFGGDYETKDGTRIRDYIHVMAMAIR